MHEPDDAIHNSASSEATQSTGTDSCTNLISLQSIEQCHTQDSPADAQAVRERKKLPGFHFDVSHTSIVQLLLRTNTDDVHKHPDLSAHAQCTKCFRKQT